MEQGGNQQTPVGPSGGAGFFARHATGITLISFLVLAGGLGAAPNLPDWLRPVDLSTDEARSAALSRVLRKPKLTFEAWSEGTADDPDEAALDDEDSVDEDSNDIDGDAPADVADQKPLPLEDLPGANDNDSDANQAPMVATGPHLRIPLTPSKTARRLRAFAKRLKAPGAKIENPCVKKGPDGCLRTALDPFFAALDAVDRGEDGSHAGILTLGNSLIASDHVTDIVRKRLVERFGDGGRGYLLVDRTSKVAGRRVRTGYGTKGWHVNTFAQRPPKRPIFGFAGSSHESTGKGDRTSWKIRGADSGKLFWLDHQDAADFRLEIDGELVAVLTPELDANKQGPNDRTFDFAIPPGAKKLVLTTEGAKVVIFGVALEKNTPGVTWDTLGVPASDSQIYVEKTNADIFTRQIAARAPDLLVPMVGGNETRTLAFKRRTLDEVRDSYGAMIDRMRAGAPDAACLAVSPIDAAKATAAGARLATRPQLLQVVKMEQEVAREKGCAYFNLFAAMGGKDSLQRFRRAGWVHDDLVHPRGKGGDILGQLFADALLASWVNTPPPKEAIKTRRRLVPPSLVALVLPTEKPPVQKTPADETTAEAPPLPLQLWSDALAQAERRRGRLSVVVVGDETGAAEQFTQTLREGFSDRTPLLGRGLVPAGGKNKALWRAGLRRRLQGDTHLLDGRDVVLGGAMGAGGSRLRLGQGARFDLTFCRGCKDPLYVERGFLEVAWLYTPDMGRADVLVNNVLVGELSPSSRRRTTSDVQYLRIPVRGDAHTVSVIVPPESRGPIHVFSVTQELSKSGVVVDALMLRGTTGMTMQRWRQELYGDQLLRRDYDLLIVGWGNHEAELARLDEINYRHHFAQTLQTLTDHAPHAACVVMGPAAKADAPRVDLVRSVQRAVAAQAGCAFFDPDKALPRRAGLATKSGLIKRSGRLTAKGQAQIASTLLGDLLGWHDFVQAKLSQAKEEAAQVNAEAARAKKAEEEPKG